MHRGTEASFAYSIMTLKFCLVPYMNPAWTTIYT